MKNYSNTEKVFLSIIFLSAIGIAYWGIMTLTNPYFINENFKHFTQLDLFEVKEISSGVYNYINISTQVSGGFNCLIALLIFLNLIIGMKHKNRINLLIASIGSILGYMVPFLVMDLQLGYIGFFERIEIGFVIITIITAIFFAFIFEGDDRSEH